MRAEVNEQGARVMRIGVLGAGQLALMLAEAAPALGLTVVCAGTAGDCAGRVAPLVEVDLCDRAAVRAFADTVDAVTIESENIDVAVLEGLRLFPNAHAVGIAQDRLLEKRFLETCGLGTAPYREVSSLAELQDALHALGTPAILKTRRMGYDGKGQVRLAAATQAAAAWVEVGEVPCVLEGMVRFEAEVSLIAARDGGGAIVFYPLTRNEHRDGILRTSRVPAFAGPGGLGAALQAEAEASLRRLMEALDYVGVLAVEFFVCEGGRLLANEMAPRVHNSGHWTIEGADTSQFANHLRALAHLPLGSTASRPTVMLNCIGTMPAVAETRQTPHLFRHDYGKEPRAGRKVGHLTLGAEQTEEIVMWQRRLEMAG